MIYNNKLLEMQALATERCDNNWKSSSGEWMIGNKAQVWQRNTKDRTRAWQHRIRADWNQLAERHGVNASAQRCLSY